MKSKNFFFVMLILIVWAPFKIKLALDAMGIIPARFIVYGIQAGVLVLCALYLPWVMDRIEPRASTTRTVIKCCIGFLTLFLSSNIWALAFRDYLEGTRSAVSPFWMPSLAAILLSIYVITVEKRNDKLEEE